MNCMHNLKCIPKDEPLQHDMKVQHITVQGVGR
jgi:hypothetical protein